jgi:hypothetical protein
MPAQADVPVPIDREPHVGPPRQPVRCTRYFLHGDLEIGGGHPSKLLGDELALQGALGGEVDVLPIAASAPAGSGKGTGRFHSLGRGVEDLNGVGPEE